MKNRMFYIGLGCALSTLFWTITAFAQQEKVEVENEIKQNPKMMELINEIKNLSDQVETLSRKVESLEQLIKTTIVNEKSTTIRNARPVVTRKTRPLREFDIGEVQPEDINSQSLAGIEVPKPRATIYRDTILSLDNQDTQTSDIGTVSSRGKAPKNMGEALEAIGSHIIEGLESGAKSEIKIQGETKQRAKRSDSNVIGYIKPDEIAGIRIGYTLSQVKSVHGEPEVAKPSWTFAGEEYYQYSDFGLQFALSPQLKLVNRITVEDSSPLRSKNGHGIGSSVGDIKSEFPCGEVSVSGVESAHLYCGNL